MSEQTEHKPVEHKPVEHKATRLRTVYPLSSFVVPGANVTVTADGTDVPASKVDTVRKAAAHAGVALEKA